VIDGQRIILPPRATEFRVVCAACQDAQPESRGYMGAIVKSELPLGAERGSVFCVRGHEIELVRESKATALR
jgi:hypothetical protein